MADDELNWRQVHRHSRLFHVPNTVLQVECRRLGERVSEIGMVGTLLRTPARCRPGVRSVRREVRQ